MFAAEYPRREHFTAYQPVITPAQAKEHLHNIRRQRQTQLATFNSCAVEQPHPAPNVRKPSLPEFDPTAILCQPPTPTFDATRLPSVSPCAISTARAESPRPLPTLNDDRQRRLSVSSVSSLDKRANKVYDKWPDYNRISELVGYRIDPPRPNVPPPSSQRQRGAAAKPTKARKSAGRKPRKPVAEPVVAKEPPPSPPSLPVLKPVEIVQPKLPDLLCPSSMLFSHRIQTRQWLTKHNFAVHSTRTLPLV